MRSDSFTKGLLVTYNNHVGLIDFVCEHYITICVNQFDHKSRDVCMLIYPQQWKEVHLYKESEK